MPWANQSINQSLNHALAKQTPDRLPPRRALPRSARIHKNHLRLVRRRQRTGIPIPIPLRLPHAEPSHRSGSRSHRRHGISSRSHRSPASAIFHLRVVIVVGAAAAAAAATLGAAREVFDQDLGGERAEFGFRLGLGGGGDADGLGESGCCCCGGGGFLSGGLFVRGGVWRCRLDRVC